MRILYLSDILNVHDVKFLEKFCNSGNKVILYTFYNSQKDLPFDIESLSITKLRHTYSCFPEGGANSAPVFRRLKYYIDEKMAIKQLEKDIESLKPDIIFAQWAITSGYVAAKTCFHPLVLRVWGSDVLVLPKSRLFYRKRSIAALRGADHIIFNSNYVLSESEKLAGKLRMATVLQCQLDRTVFNATRKDSSVNFSGNVIISTRPLKKIYSVDTLIKAANLVSGDVEFKIAGQGDEENNLKALADSLKGQVVFLGKIDNQKLPFYLTASTLYVSTSLSDGTSLSLLEAMSCGLPVIVTDIPSNREWVEEGVNGFLFRPALHEELAEKIRLALSDKNKLKSMGEKNIKIIAERADRDRDFSKLLNIMSDLVK